MKLVLKNNIDELTRLITAVELYGEENKIELKDIMNLSLVLEEIFTNIVFYAFNDNESHEIEVSFEKSGDAILLEVSDDGSEFNILEKPELDNLDKPAMERTIGGLGIHFVKKLMDEIIYNRIDDRNILKMKKLIEK